MFNKSIKTWGVIILFLFSSFLITSCSAQTTSKASNNNQTALSENSQGDESTTAVNGQIKIHYIDVGQGDSILIQQGNSNMLIDAGTNESTNLLISYLKKQNIKKLDYLVLTHPHEDHIGGADAVINSFNIGTVYMPQKTAPSKTFSDVISAMKSKGLQATKPQPGSTFKIGTATCTILAPNSSSYTDTNDHSIVIKMSFGSNTFLFEGDASSKSEMEMLSKGYSLKADVLKVGHHGSKTASCANFLKAVSPQYAVISVGKGNDYGHPYSGTLARIKGTGAKIYRTDEAGTIICTSDGKNISFNNNTEN